MAKKKKKPRAGAKKDAQINESPFNNPFLALKANLKKAASAASDTPAQKPAPAPADEPDGEAAFLRAMADVAPLDQKARVRRRAAPGNLRPKLHSQPDEDLEVLAQLADLISGDADFDLTMSDEFVSGAAGGVGAELVQRLCRGEFPIQDYVDLHGLGEDQALKEAEAFLAASAAKGLRHVLIVHGKGMGSPGKVPVLKNALARALSHKRFQKRVLAFCSARPEDGGLGAMYVLLRRWAGGKGRWESIS